MIKLRQKIHQLSVELSIVFTSEKLNGEIDFSEKIQLPHANIDSSYENETNSA